MKPARLLFPQFGSAGRKWLQIGETRVCLGLIKPGALEHGCEVCFAEV